MIDDLIQQQAKLQKQVDGLIKPELSPDLISPFLSIPGLVGFWPMSSVQRSTGNAYDQSGQARTLTYNGNPTYNYYNNIVPYIDLDGTGDYLSRVDETDLDIQGTEAIYAAGVRGLTLGCWFWVSGGNGTNRGLISKAVAAGQASYYLLDDNTNKLQFVISSDGTALAGTTGLANISTGQWHFGVGKFIPSTSIAVYLDNILYSQATAVASIFSGTSNFEIGRVFGGNLLTGRVSLCFLSANALSDAKISSMFQQTRGAFGV